MSSLRACANILQFDNGDCIVTQGESADGIYIILFGLVKVHENVTRTIVHVTRTIVHDWQRQPIVHV